MFKIQNFLNLTRYFVNKIQIPKNKPEYRPSLSRFFILLPSTCWFVFNLSSTNRLRFEVANSIQSESLIFKAEKKDVEELLTRIATEIGEENFEDARKYIDEGIRITEQNKFNEFLPQLYDLLTTITVREGNNVLAEEILVRSIEKLTEIGYKETDNEIVRYQLMLARLYHSKGDSDMAGLGFRNCISIQEAKFNTYGDMDGATSSLYLSLIYWYSVFLSEENELTDSKNYMKKALELSKLTSKDHGQTVVILHNLADLTFRLKEFDDVIKYLVEGLRLCIQNFSLHNALPLFMVKLGLVYLVKGMHGTAEYWCSIAHIFAKTSNNTCVQNEAALCLKYLKENKPKDE